MRHENLHPFITVTDYTFEMKVKKKNNVRIQIPTQESGVARLEKPINVPDGDRWGIARLQTKTTDADKRRAG